ncbi:DUF4233 domain-containing protein [Corynebacterium lizhenjunii]|uniref:DUF4233 domain-containing protein n=1 Tax=Corynebacterium lizhenjunii TaxID=2709394 RepID=A0A7T0PD42_9CORY|nr:DUF4233 domain-containing protein [Corynebacterium lizhenjunii]
MGLGSEPVKDPLRQFNGMVLANGLTMEVITLVLALPALRMVNQGTLWNGPTFIVLGALLAFHLVMFAFIRRPWALAAILGAQIVGAFAGLFIHWSITAIMVVFALLWLLAVYLRSVLVERMRRGYLTTQHLNTEG